MPGNKKILLIEDDPKSRFALQSVLEELGHHVTAFEDARRARDGGVGTCDVAIIDVRLPTGPGTAYAAELRSQQPDITIVFITAFDDLERADTQIAGAVILVKPIDMTALLKLL